MKTVVNCSLEWPTKPFGLAIGKRKRPQRVNSCKMYLKRETSITASETHCDATRMDYGTL